MWATCVRVPQRKHQRVPPEQGRGGDLQEIGARHRARPLRRHLLPLDSACDPAGRRRRGADSAGEGEAGRAHQERALDGAELRGHHQADRGGDQDGAARGREDGQGGVAPRPGQHGRGVERDRRRSCHVERQARRPRQEEGRRQGGGARRHDALLPRGPPDLPPELRRQEGQGRLLGHCCRHGGLHRGHRHVRRHQGLVRRKSEGQKAQKGSLSAVIQTLSLSLF
mmetsp:Transcript_16101/g.40941  ORF Transcript_16101/g.40941 Transcript_16101/m.40941 type:complete len:225 (+) Transcript_16101:206-880(+)